MAKIIESEPSSKKITTSTYYGANLSGFTLRQVARLDNKIFCGEPWNEGTFCESCGGMQGHGPACNTCGILAISVDERSILIGSELQNKNSKIAIIKDGEEVVGYGWGYQYDSVEDFVSSKYQKSETQQAVKAAINNFGISSSFYYYSGMGIDMDYRGQGLSNIMGKEIDDHAKSLGLPGITRTYYNSPIVKMRQNLNFEIIVGPQIQPKADFDNPNRVLMARI